jgi:alkylhydroperoxidase family enzyme
VTGRHAAVLARLHDAVLGPDGALPYETRLALATGRGIPAELEPFAAKIARHAYRVSEHDLEALRAAGFDDDAIFEATVAVALGAGLHRRDVGLAALRNA